MRFKPLGLLALVVGCAAPGIPARQTVLMPELSSSSYSESREQSRTLRALGAGVHAAHYWGPYGVGGGAEASLWRNKTVSGDEARFSAALIGANAELLSAEGRLRSRIGGGLAVLLQGSENDDPGALGFYFEIKPAAYRFALSERWGLGVSPISLIFIVPEPSGIPLVDIQYRSSVSLEVQL